MVFPIVASFWRCVVLNTLFIFMIQMILYSSRAISLFHLIDLEISKIKQEHIESNEVDIERQSVRTDENHSQHDVLDIESDEIDRIDKDEIEESGGILNSLGIERDFSRKRDSSKGIFYY